jgi:hypothetical protein
VKGSPRISVIVATIERWPAVQACLDRLLPQVAAAGGAVRSLREREAPTRARRSLPAMGLLCVANATGKLTGLLFGEGASARRLN